MGTHSSNLTWKIHKQRNLVGYSPWGHKELDTTGHARAHVGILMSYLGGKIAMTH